MKTNKNKIRLKVGGMSCANCAKGIKNHLAKHGLKEISVNFSTGDTTYSANTQYTQKQIKQIIKDLGYSILSDYKKEKISKTEKYLYITLPFTVILFSHMFSNNESFLHNPILQFFLCIPVYIIGVIYFGKSAWNSLKSTVPNMNVLIFTGSSAAFLYSIIGWLLFSGTEQAHDYLFFETTATIITLVLLGNVLEQKSIKKTTTAISDLSEIQKVVARKEINGKIIELNYEEIQIDDILIVNTGDKIPTDAIIISGSAYIDESMITGESLELNKNKNDEVIGGTMVSKGSLKIKATKIGNDTLLSKIIELVRNAENNKPNIQKIGDQISAVFVPIVLLIAMSTFLIGHYLLNIEIQDALLRAIAVLVISCPCAMGLATPTAIMAGIGRAAKNGILIKGGDTLEKIANIKNIVFDKTGTLTTGDFTISDFTVLNKNKKEVQNIIYNIEKHSSHPIAKSLCTAFKPNSTILKVSNINEEKGISISAEINNKKYTIGSSRISSSERKESLLIMENEKLIATLNIRDKLKKNTTEIISLLHKQNYNTILLSGDTKEKCTSVAKILGMKTNYYQQLPQDKITKIEELINTDPTAMVGDGINDAPALAKATIGISLGNANHIAIQSADVILLNSTDIDQLPKALQIGKHSLRTIQQNLFWAFSYNIIAIPIAIMGMLNPMWAALFMAFSDIVVIGNSIRLRYKKIF